MNMLNFMLTELRNFFGYAGNVTPVCSIVIATCAFVVTYHQLGLAKQRLRLDLFDRRLRAKDALFGLADAFANETTNPRPQAWAGFYKDAYSCRFVYPIEAAAWISGIQQKVYKLWFVLEPAGNRLIASPVRDEGELKRSEAEQAEIRNSIGNLYKETEAHLDPYLHIAQPTLCRFSWKCIKSKLGAIIWQDSPITN
jgi:hypothetical protein